jgi:hypothetical protein
MRIYVTSMKDLTAFYPSDVPPEALEAPLVYVGRKMYYNKTFLPGSPLGNPFTVKKHPRDATVLFKKHLWAKIQAQDPEVMAALSEIEFAAKTTGVRLGCWCAGSLAERMCHANVIRDAVVWLASRGQTTQEK